MDWVKSLNDVTLPALSLAMAFAAYRRALVGLGVASVEVVARVLLPWSRTALVVMREVLAAWCARLPARLPC